ncbi:MAG: hypothetical protein NT115_07570 [Proteobacteria bacterium]|nr:hypothetical protein [Pseudomonadota bacterium]
MFGLRTPPAAGKTIHNPAIARLLCPDAPSGTGSRTRSMPTNARIDADSYSGRKNVAD